jgi:hypothetical protein
VHFRLTSSGLRGILSWLEAAGIPFFLDPFEGTAISKLQVAVSPLPVIYTTVILAIMQEFQDIQDKD